MTRSPFHRHPLRQRSLRQPAGHRHSVWRRRQYDLHLDDLGLFSDYPAEPRETLELIRDWGIAVVQGNCEEPLGADAPDCGCGFDAGTDCSLLSVEWYQYARQRVSAADRAWMRALPKSLCFQLAGRQIRVVHGGVKQINRFIFPSTPIAVKVLGSQTGCA